MVRINLFIFLCTFIPNLTIAEGFPIVFRSELFYETGKDSASTDFTISFGVYGGWYKNGNLESSIPSDLNVETDKLLPRWFINADIIGPGKWGIGFQYAGYQTEFEASRFFSRELSWWGIFTEHEDYIRVEATGKSYSLSALYRVTEYEKRRQLLEVILRGGVNYIRFTERQELHADLYITPYSYGAATGNFDFNAKALNAFLSASCHLHFSRRLSLLMELSESIPIINSEMPESSVTAYSVTSQVNTSKTIALGKHKQNTAGFTLGFGFTFHF